MISDVLDLNGWCGIVAHGRIEHISEAWRGRDENDFMTINYFVINSTEYKKMKTFPLISRLEIILFT